MKKKKRAPDSQREIALKFLVYAITLMFGVILYDGGRMVLEGSIAKNERKYYQSPRSIDSRSVSISSYSFEIEYGSDESEPGEVYLDGGGTKVTLPGGHTLYQTMRTHDGGVLLRDEVRRRGRPVDSEPPGPVKTV